MKNNLTNYMVVNNDGEIIHYLSEGDIKILNKNYGSCSKFNENVKNIINYNEFKSEMNNNMGSFYFYFHKDIIKNHNQYLFRFLYLSTYMNYKGYLQFGNSNKYSESSLVVKKDIQEILKLKKDTFYKTIKYFEDNKWIKYDENNKVFINNKICIRGCINKRRDCIRMFDKEIKELYENSSTSEQKTISLLFKLIPNINKNTGLIVSNVDEDNIEKLKPLKQKDIISILNLNNKKSFKCLTNLKIMNGTESAFIKLSNAFIKNVYMINPRILYGGNDINNLKDVINNYLPLFKIGTNI